MKKIFSLIVLLSVLCSCGPRKTKLEHGPIIRCADGMMLPITKEPGKMVPEFNISLGFKPEGVYLQSDKMLDVCYIGIIWEDYSMQIDLDFIDRYGDRYTYFIGYNHFATVERMNKIQHLAVYYAPSDVPVPMKDGIDPDGNQFSYPDFTGYCFYFNGEEVNEYFQLMMDYMKEFEKNKSVGE